MYLQYLMGACKYKKAGAGRLARMSVSGTSTEYNPEKTIAPGPRKPLMEVGNVNVCIF
jgi:hypothetical protein